MAKKCAYHTEGDHRHDDQRLAVGLERNGHQGIDGKYREEEALQQADHSRLFILAGTVEAGGNMGIFTLELRHKLLLDLLHHLGGLHFILVGVGGYGNRPATIHPGYGRVRFPQFEFGHGREGHRHAIWRADHHVLQMAYGAALFQRITHHHLDLFLVA